MDGREQLEAFANERLAALDSPQTQSFQHQHDGHCNCALRSLSKLEMGLYYAIKDRDLARFSRFLPMGLGPDHCFSEMVPCDAHHTTVLQLVVQENLIGAVQILLRSDTADETNIHNALMYAMRHNLIEVVRVFLKAAINEIISIEPSVTFRHAMYKAQYDLVEEVISKPKFDVNFEATWGLDRPLHIVIHHNQVGLVKQLLKQGATPDVEDRKGTTPLFVACSLGFANCASVLLQNGADPNYSNSRGLRNLYSPLQAVLKSDRDSETVVELVNLLISAGLNLQKQPWMLWNLSAQNSMIDRDICEWLENLSHQPASLKRQSLRTIRNMIIENHKSDFIGGVNSLPIAPGLKTYLTLGGLEF